MKPFYEKNTAVVESEMNVLFEDLLVMTPDEFRVWVGEMRKIILTSWDETGSPPRMGKTEDVIIDNWNKLAEYPTHTFTHTDELSDIEDDVIINKSRMGVEVDQFFSNMMKTRINYSDSDNGYSIYDLFADDTKFERIYKGALRHLRRDSFYNHALSAIKYSTKYSVVDVPDAESWMKAFFDNPTIFAEHDFLLEQVKIREGLNSGYFQIEQSDILQLTREQLEKWIPKLSYRHHSTFDIENLLDDRLYAIRIYKKGNRVFPAGLKSFRIGYIQPAVNFPPMTAKYLYERYTEHIKDQDTINIYDPSSGWGGRILGAMSVRDDRHIHYVGTDPNPDNIFPDDGVSKYQHIADFYNTKTYRGNPFFSQTNTYEIFSEGSEVVHIHPDFRKYKGKLDMIFTSPPYFNREAYSEDENQSYKKYGSSYESWRHGFLAPTLETCAEYLRPGRYLLWNIADVLIKGNYLPLEKDSKDILESFGLVYQYRLKMALESMPGQNRIGEDGVPKCKNFCKVDGKFLKYEPIMIFYKPE